jgi:2-keto-4-pentenoate hydratase
VLREAEAAHTAVGPVSDLVEGGLTHDQAHESCELNIARRQAAGEVLAGFKVGFTNIAVRDRMGLPDSTYGYPFEGCPCRRRRDRHARPVAPKIETELCLRLGRDLEGPGVTTETALPLSRRSAPRSRSATRESGTGSAPTPDFFADNGSARIVLGGTGWTPVGDVDLLGEGVVLAQDGVDLAEGRARWRSRHPGERGRVAGEQAGGAGPFVARRYAGHDGHAHADHSDRARLDLYRYVLDAGRRH